MKQAPGHEKLPLTGAWLRTAYHLDLLGRPTFVHAFRFHRHSLEFNARQYPDGESGSAAECFRRETDFNHAASLRREVRQHNHHSRS